MNIQINMLNVGDGDAIIVHLTRNTEHLVVLIDAGHPGDAQLCFDALTPVLKSSGKTAPDLIVVSHYDSDHIGGMTTVVEKYKGAIKKAWLHKPRILMKVAAAAPGLLLEHLANSPEYDLIEDYDTFNHPLKTNDARQLVLESYNQMKGLMASLDSYSIPTEQPLAGHTLAGWEEIKVLGPTETFYKDCLKKMKDVPQVIEQETQLMLNESRKPHLIKFTKFIEKSTNPCEFLKTQKKDHVTEVNQISIIIQIVVDGNKYLFTGDASLESFENIPAYPESLKNIYWLKVPHHGSHNNSSPELFDIMAPKFADISGGDRYLDEEVPGCLTAKNVKVRSTLEAGHDLIFPY